MSSPAGETGGDVVVVPATPGPLRALPSGRTPDEVDALLDDLLGPDDQGGPGVADAVLATGGGAAVVAGVVLSAPLLLAGGIGAVVLGSVLPARSLWRRAQSRRLTARRTEVLGEGTPLRVTPGPVADLVAAHSDLWARVEASPELVGAEERATAHAAVADVAAVLGGEAPTGPDLVAFVAERAVALADLVAVIDAGTTIGAGGEDLRRARLDARHEVDAIEGAASVDRLRRLADDRRPGTDGG